MTRDQAMAEIRDAQREGRWADLRDADMRGASMRGATLRGADLADADLRGAVLAGADLRGADLRGAVLAGADLRGADLRRANLYGANLYGANLYGANLYGANLGWADMRDADLRRAVLAGARLPAPQVVLLAYWGRVSDTLTTLLMRYDAASHPVGQRAFSAWAEGGPCPYADCRWQRAANFTEVRELWSPGPSRSPIRLAEMVLDECCPGWRDDTGESPEGE